MITELICVDSSNHKELSIIESSTNVDNAWEKACEILRVGLISKTNKPLLFQKVIEIYENVFKKSKSIPRIDDIMEEIIEYNGKVLDRASELLYNYKGEWYRNTVRNLSGDGHQVLDEQVVDEEARNLVYDTLYDNLAYSNIEAEIEDVNEILTEAGRSFVISWNDCAYDACPELYNANAELICNDCQLSILPAFSIGERIRLYGEKKPYYYNSIIIDKDSKRIPLLI